MSWSLPSKMIAHRGGGQCAPENTLAGMRAAYERGFKAVEFDVMLTSDGIPILMHDEVLGRTLSGTGKISDYSFTELKEKEVGGWFDQSYGTTMYQGESIPQLQDVLAYCYEHHLWMNIELKPVPGYEVETGKRVARDVLAYWTQCGGVEAGMAYPLLSSFSLASLRAAFEEAPAIPRGLLYELVPHDWYFDWKALEAVSVHSSYPFLTAAKVHEVKQAGAVMLCYTVNDVDSVRALESWGVDGFFTDALDVFDSKWGDK
jgi:glycerophosphoryl diester phosphodiesterase